MAMYGNRGVLGGSVGDGYADGLTESGGQDLDMGAVADGEYLKRDGTDIVGGTPAGGAAATDIKDSVITVATANITLSGEQTLNSVLTSTSRVGVVAQTDPIENGIYVTAAGAWARATDADADAEVTQGMAFLVASGDKQGSWYVCESADPLTVDTSELVFVECTPPPAAHALDSTTYHAALSDNTNHDMSTSAHGFAPKGSGVADEFLNSSGGWSTPIGTGSTASQAGNLVVQAKKGSAGTINKGDAVYQSGWNAGGWIEVELAVNDSESTMPAYGIANESISNSVLADVVVSGTVSGVNTSAFTVLDALYVNGVGGALTATKPTGTALIQRLGIAARIHATLGVIQVTGAGRTNDIPNLPENYIWEGNASGVATAVDQATLAVASATTATTASTSNALASATTTVNVSSATAPTVGQILTATSDSAATWQTSAAGVHDIGGAQHNSSTVSAINGKIDDANIGWPISNKTTDYSVPSSASGTCFTNAGASGTVIFTLPAAAAGLEYIFTVDAAQILRVTTNGGADNIRIGDAATAGAGSIESANIGDTIVIKCINTDDWVAVSNVGTWNLASTAPGTTNVSPFVPKTSDYTVTTGDNGTCFSNTGASGAVIFTLPGAAAGLEYTFFCHAAQTVTITCTTGDTLRVLSSTTSADGTAYTSTSGTVIHIKGQNANGWFTMSQMGTWTLT